MSEIINFPSRSTINKTRLRKEIGARVKQVRKHLSMTQEQISKRLKMGRVNYSMLDNDLLSAEAGFEYDSCCWAIQVFGQRLIRNSTASNDAYETGKTRYAK